LWRALVAAARAARGGVRPGAWFTVADAGGLQPTDAADPRAEIGWRPEGGWALRHAHADDADPQPELYLPVCAARRGRPIVVAHLGQSLDGFIATRTGQSRSLNGAENIVHLHRLRALCDAIVVGAGTVAADDPQLTTRLVPGPNPLRVVLDPRRRLPPHHAVFCDGAAPTLLVCDTALARAGERFGQAEVAGVQCADGRLDLAAVLAALNARGCIAIFVEGGGVTVSAFLAAGLVDRLHVTVAPVVIGAGRPGLRLPAIGPAPDARPPAHRVFRMGADLLFDFDLRADRSGA
jgi:riboflavin-specific deaminase-like protein